MTAKLVRVVCSLLKHENGLLKCFMCFPNASCPKKRSFIYGEMTVVKSSWIAFLVQIREHIICSGNYSAQPDQRHEGNVTLL